MDYLGVSPRTAAGKSFFTNWSEHAFLGSALDQMGADMAQWSFSNDGEEIDEETCRKWAALIRDRAGELHVVQVPGRDNHDRTRMWLVVGRFDQATAIARAHEAAQVGVRGVERHLARPLVVVSTMRLGEIGDLQLARGGSAAKSDAVRVELQPLTVERLNFATKFLLTFATFLDECGGCEQW